MSEESARFLTNGHIKVFLNDFGVSFVPAVGLCQCCVPFHQRAFFLTADKDQCWAPDCRESLDSRAI